MLRHLNSAAPTASYLSGSRVAREPMPETKEISPEEPEQDVFNMRMRRKME